MEIGLSRANITPGVGIPLSGFAGRGVSQGIHDPLLATVLVATSGREGVGIVGCDLLGVCDEIAGEIREEVAGRTGLEAVLISCSHTHYGPDLYTKSDREDEAAYQSNLKFLIAGAFEEAMDKRQEATVGVGWGESRIGINRREKMPDGTMRLGHNPGGPIDRSVGVCRIDSAAGESIGTIVNFATHPVSQAGKMRLISADYPGQMRGIVENLTGATCLFMQGACGDINSVRMENRYEPARSLGTRLGCEVVRIWETISPDKVSGIGSAAKTVQLPRYRFGSAENARLITEQLAEEHRRLKGEGGDAGLMEWAQTRLERVTGALESWETGVEEAPVSAEVAALHIGELAIAAFPGEVFNQIGSAVKTGSPFPQTFFAGYSGGTIGYIPTPEAYDEGGYEVSHACKVDPRASDMLVETAGDLLTRLG